MDAAASMSDSACTLTQCLDECREDCQGALSCPEAYALAQEDAAFPADQLNTLKNVTIFTSILSVFGSAFIIVTYHFESHYKRMNDQALHT